MVIPPIIHTQLNFLLNFLVTINQVGQVHSLVIIVDGFLLTLWAKVNSSLSPATLLSNIDITISL